MKFYKKIIIPAAFLSGFLLCISCAVLQPANPHVSSNKGDPMEPTRQINRVDPPRRDPSRYLNSNKKKKKNPVRLKRIPPTDCPIVKSYTSGGEKKIKHRVHRTRRKLRRERRRD